MFSGIEVSRFVRYQEQIKLPIKIHVWDKFAKDCNIVLDLWTRYKRKCEIKTVTERWYRIHTKNSQPGNCHLYHRDIILNRIDL